MAILPEDQGECRDQNSGDWVNPPLRILGCCAASLIDREVGRAARDDFAAAISFRISFPAVGAGCRCGGGRDFTAAVGVGIAFVTFLAWC